jgi:hypothetical protein
LRLLSRAPCASNAQDRNRIGERRNRCCSRKVLHEGAAHQKSWQRSRHRKLSQSSSLWPSIDEHNACVPGSPGLPNNQETDAPYSFQSPVSQPGITALASSAVDNLVPACLASMARPGNSDRHARRRQRVGDLRHMARSAPPPLGRRDQAGSIV